VIDLYTALKLCSTEDYIMLYGDELTKEEITEKYDLRKIKVKKIYFDRWHNVMRFETE
jgi:hypothetical protein